MKKFLPVLVFALMALLLSACATSSLSASQNGVEVYDARVLLPGGDAMQGMQTSLAGFMLIKNTSASADRLLGISADFADASLHLTKISNDVMSMDEVPSIEIPAGQMVELNPSSYHIMLVNVANPPRVGERVNLVLEFEKAGKITVPAVVTDK